MKIIDLRDARHHLETLACWHHEQWSEYNEGESLQQRIERMTDYLGDSYIPSTFIAIDDILLGSAAIVDNDMQTRPELSPWLASVYVNPARRNLGIGSKLVKHVMSTASTNQIDELYLFTPDRTAFYLNLGWEIVDNEHYRGHDVTIMRCDLKKLF